MSQEEKVSYNLLSLNYPPLVGSLALYLKKVYNMKMNKILFIKAQRDMLDIFDDAQIKYLGYLPKDKYLIKALLFQGFIPLSNFKLRKGYAYIMTNRMLEKEYYVLPIRLADNYKTLQKEKYQFYIEVFGKAGIPGITKIRYSNE